MSIFFEKFESSLNMLRAKRIFSDHLGYNILELYNAVLVQIRLTTSKTKCDIYYGKHGVQVAERLKILGNKEILEISEIWVET